MKLLQNDGMTMVEIAVAMGIAVLLVIGSSSILRMVYSHAQFTEKSSQRTTVNFEVVKKISNPETLKVSAQLLPLNEKLKACLLGGNTSTCTSNCCAHNEPFEFYGLDPIPKDASVTSRKKITGLTEAPVRYTLAGENCPPDLPESKCAYTLVSKATAHCPGSTTTCDHADYLSIEVAIKPLPGSSLKDQSLKLIHFVELNYSPTLAAIPAQSLTDYLNIPITPNPGYATEPAVFVFAKCSSSDPTVATVQCFGFIDGSGVIKVQRNGTASGTTNITIQVDDTQEENSLSNEITFPVTTI